MKHQDWWSLKLLLLQVRQGLKHFDAKIKSRPFQQSNLIFTKSPFNFDVDFSQQMQKKQNFVFFFTTQVKFNNGKHRQKS